MQGQYTVSVTPESVATQNTAGTSSKTGWNIYNYWREGKDVILLVFHSGSYFLLSLRELPDAQRDELRGILTAAFTDQLSGLSPAFQPSSVLPSNMPIQPSSAPIKQAAAIRPADSRRICTLGNLMRGNLAFAAILPHGPAILKTDVPQDPRAPRIRQPEFPHAHDRGSVASAGHAARRKRFG